GGVHIIGIGSPLFNWEEFDLNTVDQHQHVDSFRHGTRWLPFLDPPLLSSAGHTM
ncbi:hypothetical protein ACJMK2_002733, partial [Sinanodonta woodiana]